MVRLQRGDRLPIVAALQILLNRAARASLEVDGDFGPATEGAVRRFQEGLRSSTGDRPGRVGPPTWDALARTTGWVVRDIMDMSDPEMEGLALPEFREAGSSPIQFYGGSNALGWIHPSIAETGVREGSMVLLRILGHGNRGTAVVGYGTGCHILYHTVRGTPEEMPRPSQCAPNQIQVTPEEIAIVRTAMSRSAMNEASLGMEDVVRQLAPLAPMFAPCGSIEFHGCRVGLGEEGERFLARVANLFHVPAVGAHRSQHMGHLIRYDGPVTMAFPNGGNLAGWAGRLEG